MIMTDSRAHERWRRQGRAMNEMNAKAGAADASRTSTAHGSMQKTKLRGKSSLYDVYVGSLPPTASEDEVFSLFSRVAPVRDLWLAKQTQGSTHTYGFVRFLKLAECQDVVRHLDGKTFKGTKIRVQLSVSLIKMISKNQDVIAGFVLEAEKKALMLYNQKCRNFSARNIRRTLSKLPVSVSTPGMDEGPMCASVLPSCGCMCTHHSEHSKQTRKLTFVTTKVVVTADFIAVFTMKNLVYSSYYEIKWQGSLSRSCCLEENRTVDHATHDMLHPVNDSDRDPRKEQLVKLKRLQARIRQLQCELDALNVELRKQSEENDEMSGLHTAATTACSDLSQIFSNEEEILRTEMEIDLQQEEYSSRVERLEMIYEKERLQGARDSHSLYEMELEISVEKARQSVLIAKLEGKILTCRSQSHSLM